MFQQKLPSIVLLSFCLTHLKTDAMRYLSDSREALK